jgi:hypothetical protein
MITAALSVGHVLVLNARPVLLHTGYGVLCVRFLLYGLLMCCYHGGT